MDTVISLSSGFFLAKIDLKIPIKYEELVSEMKLILLLIKL